MQNELILINKSSQLGGSCQSAGRILLGNEVVLRPNPLSLSELRRDQTGCVVDNERVMVQVGSKSWYGLMESSYLTPGLELDIANTTLAMLRTAKVNFNVSTYPGVVVELGTNPLIVVATPKDKAIWDEPTNEKNSARLAMRRLLSKESGIELQHMLTLVLNTLLTGQDKELSLEAGAHATHHSQSNAKSAIAQNFLKGSARLGILALGKNQNNNQWIILNHDGEKLLSGNINKKLSQEEEVKILANGIAVAVHHIIQSGLVQDNPDIKPHHISATLIDTALDLSNNYQSSAGDISSKLSNKLRSTRRI